jgi:hypothetical protein
VHYGLGFFIVGSFILTGWMFTDAIIWYYKGVHELHINNEGIRVIKGKNQVEIYIPKEKITDIMVYRKGFRKNLNIMLGNQVMDVPGIITLYPGKRIQMFSDAFEDRDFNEAITWLEKLHPVKPTKTSIIHRLFQHFRVVNNTSLPQG